MDKQKNNEKQKNDWSTFAEGFFDHIKNVSPEVYADLENELGNTEFNKPSDIARTVIKAMDILDRIKDSYDNSTTNNSLFGPNTPDVISNLSEEHMEYGKRLLYSLLIPADTTKYAKKLSEATIEYAFDSIMNDYTKK